MMAWRRQGTSFVFLHASFDPGGSQGFMAMPGDERTAPSFFMFQVSALISRKDTWWHSSTDEAVGICLHRVCA